MAHDRITPALSVPTLLLVLTASASANDWPQWRGSALDNVSAETGWSSVGREAPVWTKDVGMGYSSPSIAGGRLLIAGYFGAEETPGEGIDRVSCLDAATGETLWTYEYPAKIYDNEHGGGTLSTPTIAGDTVFVASREGGVRSFALADGALNWEVDLVARHEVDPSRYGFAGSPVLIDGQLIVNAGPTIALDPATGETLWISENYATPFSTAAPIRLGERSCIVVFGKAGLVVMDASNGEHVHTYEFHKSPRNVEGATPIVLGERVFISSAYDHGGALVDFSGDAPEELWRSRRMRTKMAGCTHWNGMLYGFDESLLMCMDLEGKERWRERGLGHGALAVADGRLLLTSSKGELIVATATPDEFREEARAQVIDRGVFWTAPVLANGRIYVRGSLGDLVCRDHSQPAAATTMASANAEAAGELPTAAALVTRHLEASGLAEHPVDELTMAGRVEVKALGLADVAGSLSFGADGRWHQRFDLPGGIGGTINKYFDGESGWEVNPYMGNKWLADPVVAELRATGGGRTLFVPIAAGQTAGAVTAETFRDVPCYRVDVKLGPDASRRLYFDRATGLLFARTGDEESTVVFQDWRDVDGVRLPFLRTEFELDTGLEWRWKFAEARLEGPDPEAFVVPEDLLEAAAGVEESAEDTEQG